MRCALFISQLLDRNETSGLQTSLTGNLKYNTCRYSSQTTMALQLWTTKYIELSPVSGWVLFYISPFVNSNLWLFISCQ